MCLAALLAADIFGGFREFQECSRQVVTIAALNRLAWSTLRVEARAIIHDYLSWLSALEAHLIDLYIEDQLRTDVHPYYFPYDGVHCVYPYEDSDCESL